MKPREYGTRSEPLIDKFMRRVDQQPDGHWRWTGHLTRQGYGRFSLKVAGKNKTVAAHRWLFEQRVRQLEPGEQLERHPNRCSVRSCVRAEHWRVKPPGSGSLATRDECRKGHVLAEVGVRVDERGTYLCLACEKVKLNKSRALFFQRRAAACARQGLEFIVCVNNHRLDLDGALSRNGTCKKCNSEYARLQRSRKAAARSGAEDSL